MKKFLRIPFLNKSTVFLTVASGFLIINLYALTAETSEIRKTLRHRKKAPYIFLGDRFRGIDAFVGKAPYLGYFTDKNIDRDILAARQYAQAQLVLAPSILDFNNTSHEYVIFDCTSPAVAMAKIQQISAKPLKVNPYGIILAQNPNRASHHQGNSHKTFDKTKHKQRP